MRSMPASAIAVQLCRRREKRGAKMHFDRFDFGVDIQDVYILPTIRISTQYEMIDKNFNIQIHFAVFHFRWRWVDG